jgi:hypothetical protein
MSQPQTESQRVIEKQVIQRLAYKLWQDAGSPPNSEWHYWFEAERLLEQTLGSGNAIQEAEAHRLICS